MFALWWSCATKWYGDACPKLCIPFNVLCMLYLLPTITKGRTIHSAWWSTVLSTWFWEGYLFIAAPLPRWWIFNGWNATKRRTTRTKTTTNNINIKSTTPIQGIIRNVAETVSQNTRSIGQRYGPKCTSCSSVVPGLCLFVILYSR